MLMSTIRAPLASGQPRRLADPVGIAACKLDDMRGDAAPSARSRDSSLPRTNSSDATISETTRPAPQRWAMRRITTSVTPDIGARKQGDAKACVETKATQPENEASNFLLIYWTKA